MSFRVLAVDDSPVMRALLRRALGVAGVQVGEFLQASDGAEALQVLGRHWVDLVLADLNMPNMNGEDLLRRMRGDDALRDVPVVVVSTDRGVERRATLEALGISGYVAKPFTPEQFRDAVARVLPLDAERRVL